ncbi:MAG: ACP S-malonyltransferase [Methylomonas sp.]|jgi:[acyl-carrier-protein] S-malonyltransferase
MNEQNYNIAFLFPGQGSQSVGMLSALAETYPSVKQTFAEASEVLGLDLWDMAANGPEDVLNRTQNTQPAMLTAGVAVWRVWRQVSGIRPGWMAGHSLGEWTALVCSGAMNFTDAVRLVAARGRLMQEATPEGVGAMAAIIGLEDHQVVNICAEMSKDGIVSAANFNAPGQVVIAGETALVERAIQALKDQGAKKTVKLLVSVPSHCALMMGAAGKLNELLCDINIEMPNTTLIHNSDVKSHGSAEVIRNALREQLFNPVRWVESIKFMREQGVFCFVECGPGKVLLGLNKRIAPDALHIAIHDPESLNNVLGQLNG